MNDAQKAVISLVFIPCAFVSVALFKLARRFEEANRIVLYVWITALLFGEFLFPMRSTGYLQGCTMIGFFVMYALQRYVKICTDNPYYTEPDFSTPDVTSITIENGTKVADFIHVNAADDVASVLTPAMDRISEVRKRMRITRVVIIAMVALCVLEGFYVEATWKSIILFFIDKVLETTIVCVAMIHAMMHCPSEKSKPWYWIITAIWCVVCVLSTITILVDNDGTYVTRHPATSVFYAVCSGCLLWLASYFVWINHRDSNKYKTTADVVVFAIGASISWIVGFYS
jgi:hypothetical protein